MDLFFAATHGGTTLGRDGPTVLMRVGLGLLKWIEPTVMKVTPNDSIQACMSIQEAGADLFSAAHIDMLLYTSFEDIGPLHTVQQMRARLVEELTQPIAELLVVPQVPAAVLAPAREVLLARTGESCACRPARASHLLHIEAGDGAGASGPPGSSRPTCSG